MKIGRTKSGALWAFGGAVSRQETFVKWVEGNREGTPPEFDDDKTVGILIENGTIREWWGTGWVPELSPFAAWGSGMDFALAAMEMGAGSEEAVAVACKFDVWSGGAIVRMTVTEQPAELVKEPAPTTEPNPDLEPPELRPLNFEEMIAKYGVTPQSEGGAQPEDWREARGLR